MRYGAGSLIALGTLICGFGTACSSGGSDGGGANPFSAQLLPALLNMGGGFGGAAFAPNGDLLVVGGGTDTIYRISRSDGSVSVAATNATGVNGNQLLSIVAPSGGVLYVGDDMGFVYAVDAGVSTQLADTMAGAINGLEIAPNSYGDFAGDLIAATELGGILDVERSPGAPVDTIADPGQVYADLAFLGTTLYALDYDNAEIDTVSAAGTVTDGVAMGFTSPDGIAADAVNGQLLVADSGVGELLAVAVPGGSATRLGAFGFDGGPEPSGLAFDGVRNLALLTDGSLVVLGVGIPGYDPADFPAAIANSDGGFGAMALDRDGNLVGVANDDANDTNRVFRVARTSGSVSDVTTNLGNPAGGELLLGVAVDPATSTTYVGTSDGNIYAVNAGGSALFATTTLAGEDVDGLALAPSTFGGGLGGDLVAVTDQGRVLSFDIASPVENQIYDGTETFSALAFAADGTLYVADSAGGEVVTVTAGGMAATFAMGLGVPDGLAIDEGGARLLVADSMNDELLEVAIPGGADSVLSSAFDFDGGAEPSGLVFDGLSTVLLGTGEASATIRTFTAFP